MDYILWHHQLFYSAYHIDMQQNSSTTLTETTAMTVDTNTLLL